MAGQQVNQIMNCFLYIQSCYELKTYTVSAILVYVSRCLIEDGKRMESYRNRNHRNNTAHEQEEESDIDHSKFAS